MDNHTDTFKVQTYFQKGDIILDPFSGSGTTLVQANELGMHAIGIDVSEFNTLINNCKVAKYNFADILIEINRITNVLKEYIAETNTAEFEATLLERLSTFNNKN